MPEFEEENINVSPSENYTPSKDASGKPRTRRRSGGFKAELAPLANTQVGEVSAAQALKEEKLSGQASSSPEPESERSEPSVSSEPQKRVPCEHRETNPQPSAETLQAIALVEARVAERLSERNKRRGAKPDRKPQTKRKTGKSRGKHPKGGLLAMIGGWFSILFGNKSKSASKKGGHRRGKGRGGRPRGKGGSRNGQNRGRGGNRRAQGRKQDGGGRGSRKSNRNAAS